MTAKGFDGEEGFFGSLGQIYGSFVGGLFPEELCESEESERSEVDGGGDSRAELSTGERVDLRRVPVSVKLPRNINEQDSEEKQGGGPGSLETGEGSPGPGVGGGRSRGGGVRLQGGDGGRAGGGEGSGEAVEAGRPAVLGGGRGLLGGEWFPGGGRRAVGPGQFGYVGAGGLEVILEWFAEGDDGGWGQRQRFGARAGVLPDDREREADVSGEVSDQGGQFPG
ncbi:hypothetical protein OIY81_2119 [Cryptosporidium canis]|nr:hypothetical protein OIY81_2119 [Cryptosporidium canis]